MHQVITVEFMRSGKFCNEFGHEFKIENHYDDTDKMKCKYCGTEKWL